MPLDLEQCTIWCFQLARNAEGVNAVELAEMGHHDEVAQLIRHWVSTTMLTHHKGRMLECFSIKTVVKIISARNEEK